MFFNRNCCFNQQNVNMCDPIIEKPITRVIEKEFYHEVPQVWCKSDNI